MNPKAYGQLTVAESKQDWLSRAVEDIEVLGYTVLPGLLDETERNMARERVDKLYAQQEKAYGAERLAAIGDTWTARAPLLYDDHFLRLATHPSVLQLVGELLGDYFILSLQNAILNNAEGHPQAAWHRDLPYQDWVPSRPVAVNVLYALDDFSAASGGTLLLPFSHRLEKLPSWDFFDRHQVVAEAPAGSALVFNSWLVHRAGDNISGRPRRAMNHLYTSPIVKQQYDFPRALNGKWADDPQLARLLGYDSQVAFDDVAWRDRRSARLKQRGDLP